MEGYPGELHDVPPPEAFPMLVFLKAAADAEAPLPGTNINRIITTTTTSTTPTITYSCHSY